MVAGISLQLFLPQGLWQGRLLTFYLWLVGLPWICCYRTSRHCCRQSVRRLAQGGCMLHHHALFGHRSVAGQLGGCQKFGHACGHEQRLCGFSPCSLRSCSLRQGGGDPSSNRHGVHHGVSLPRSSSMLHTPLGSTSLGRLARMACVTQSLAFLGGKHNVFFRMRTWDPCVGHARVMFDMVGSGGRSTVALGRGSGAQLSPGSTPCRCARHWLLL